MQEIVKIRQTNSHATVRTTNHFQKILILNMFVRDISLKTNWKDIF